jgi:hypothetical protein
MPRLVILSEGLTGRAHELKVEKTTIGRVDDNTFPIPEPRFPATTAKSSCAARHHPARPQLHQRHFVNGQQVTGEAVIKSGQIIRLGQVEMRLEMWRPKPPPPPRSSPIKPWSSPRASNWARSPPPKSSSSTTAKNRFRQEEKHRHQDFHHRRHCAGRCHLRRHCWSFTHESRQPLTGQPSFSHRAASAAA